MKPYSKFLGYLQRLDAADAFFIHKIFGINSFFVIRYTINVYIGFGIGILPCSIKTLHFQFYKLSIFFRLKEPTYDLL